MKAIRYVTALVPLAVGAAAAHWTTLAFWADMKEGLIAFLGFLAASLVQVMPITANFLQSDKLTPNEAKRLTESLSRQQLYWVGLLSATVVALVVVIVGAALKDRAPKWSPVFVHPALADVSWEAVVVFVVATSVSFILVRMLGLFEGMLSLHRLRGELVIAGAQRAADEKVAAMQKEAEPDMPLVPQDYGRIIQPH